MLVALAITASAAASPAQCREIPIGEMVETYAGLIQHQDSGAIAHLFGTNGYIANPGQEPVRGEVAILKLLSSFKSAVVKSETMTIASVDRVNANWRVTGHFQQAGTTPQGKDYDVGGSFDSIWTCTADGWRIGRMATGN